MIRVALAVTLAVAACRSPKTPPPAPQEPRPACDATSALSAAMALRADGYLHRALDVLSADEVRCTTPATMHARAELLSDLGMSKRAIEAYRAYARTSEQAARQAADAIAELERRPPSVREATDDERATASRCIAMA